MLLFLLFKASTHGDTLSSKEHSHLVRAQAVALVATLHASQADRERAESRDAHKAATRRVGRFQAQERTSRERQERA